MTHWVRILTRTAALAGLLTSCVGNDSGVAGGSGASPTGDVGGQGGTSSGGLQGTSQVGGVSDPGVGGGTTSSTEVTSGGQAPGGGSATGGSTTGGSTTGGSTTGGSATGATSQIGGSSAQVGGSATGGSNVTGGLSSTGGRAATGGGTNTSGGLASTGGISSTGGTSAAAAGSSSCVTKRGFASGLEISSAGDDIAALAAPDQGVSWYYGWAKSPSSQMGTAYANAGVEFVPMIWGKSAELTDANLASKIHVGAKTRHLLGFNEPNFNSQANLTPAQAAEAWPNVERVADQLGLELVGPAVNFCGGGCNVTDPFQWMDQFLAACTNCRIDYLAFHSYACDSKWFLDSYMKPAVKKYYTEGNPPRKIWVTEFACADSPPSGGWTVAQIDSYVRTVLDYFENEPGIYRYAWFGGNTGRTNDSYVTANNNLLAAGASQLTSLGTIYTSLAEAKSCP